MVIKTIRRIMPKNIQKGKAEIRDSYIKRNRYYYDELIKFMKYNIPDKAKVLEIGCGTGELISALNPVGGAGIDISENLIRAAKNKFPNINFIQMNAEKLNFKEKFDYIIISDTLSYVNDLEKLFSTIRSVTHENTRVIITFHNFLWQPILKLAEFFKLKMPQKKTNWLNRDDIINLLNLESYDIIKTGNKFLFPKFIPFLSNFVNRYIAPLPLINHFCLVGYIIARPVIQLHRNKNLKTVSVIVPARNEKGNIENAVLRIPKMGEHTEIIFIEGGSSDNTYDEIKRVYKKYLNKRDIKYAEQDGKGKGDAVRKGFAMASGDILMILDADLTVPPEDLSKFYNAIATGKGEFINGTRLVYPLKKDSMRSLNILGNKFFSVMFSWLLDQRLKDTLCGTKVISKSNYQKLILNRSYFGDFDPFGDFDLIFGAAKLNLKIVEVPIRYQAREYGDTNISRFRHGWLLFKMTIFAMNKIKFV